MKTPQILIVKPDHLGDFAVTLPALWEVSRKFGRARATIFASRPHAQWNEILPWLPPVVEVAHPRFARSSLDPVPAALPKTLPIPAPRPQTPSIPQPKRKPAPSGLAEALHLWKLRNGYTHGIELTSTRHDATGKLWLLAAGCGRRSGLKGKWDFLLNEKHDLGEGHQRHRMALRFPEEWNITGESDPSLFMPPELRHNPADVAGEIVVAPFAGQTAKEWNRERWRDLVLRLRPNVGKRKVTILAGADRSGNAVDLARISGLADSVVFIPESIRDTLERLAQAAAVVALDTAVAHYAWLTGTPTVQLFAGTADPERWGSVLALRDETLLTSEPLPPCSPCRLRVCNQPRHLCMDGIDVDRVLSALGRLTPLIPG